MQIKRTLKNSLIQKIKTSDKILIIYGARQVGKTTLAQDIMQKLKLKTLQINADEKKYHDILSSRNKNKIESLITGYELLFIDEAQRIPDIGINLKIIKDNFPSIKIIVTGSSSLDLANKTKEPLTGRTWTYQLFPISFLELKNIYNDFELYEKKDSFLIFGGYPEILSIKNIKEKKQFLEELSSSYLYKDVLEITNIKYSQKIHQLLKLLAWQIGQEVSLSELGNNLGLSKDTVNHYLDLLEQSFIIFRLSGFSRNLRKEITKMDKIYFYDLGIRNILINNLNFLENRNDLGSLWENFLISERMKLMQYKKEIYTPYFWRTYTGAEIDYIEEREGKLFAYEIKVKSKKIKAPQTWLQTYPDANFKLITTENFLEFILKV